MRATAESLKDRKIAVFRNVEPGLMNGFETLGTKEYEEWGTYVRISEYVEVRFDPLKSDEVIQGALRALDAAELKAREDLQRKLDEIRDQKAQLLALVHHKD